MSPPTQPNPSSRKPASKRFDPSLWSARLAPAIMVFLALALLLSLSIVILSILGLTPAF
jgi:hypothetical protein